MRNLILFLSLASCASYSEDLISSQEQAWSGPPQSPIVCDSSRVLCGITCIDISRDMKNCGDCDIKCDIKSGEFCYGYQCRNVKDFGVSIIPVGPVPYDVRKDLPRPPR